MRIEIKVRNKLRTVARKVEAASIPTALAAGAAMLQREIMMQAMSMGIWDTGNLINSHARRKESDTTWRIISPAEYSVYVHEGVKGSMTGDHAARPWVTLGAAKAEGPIFDMLDRAVKAALKQ